MLIAICDDEKDFIEIIHDELLKITAQNNISAEIIAYENAADFINDMEKKDFAVVFMDIDMPELSGFEVSEMIRIQNEHVQIIFVTSYEIYMHKSFAFRPFGYVVKSNLAEELSDTVKRLARYFEKNNVYVELYNKTGHIRLRLSDIYYFESRNNDIIAHGKHGEFRFRGKMSEWEKQYRTYGFSTINRGLLVNWRHVVKISRAYVTLYSNIELPISKSRYAEVEKEYLMYSGNVN